MTCNMVMVWTKLITYKNYNIMERNMIMVNIYYQATVPLVKTPLMVMTTRDARLARDCKYSQY